VLGGLIGFAPAPDIAPGLWVSLVLALLLFRAPVLITGGVFLLAKALSLVTGALCFQIGQLLLDGPTEGIYRAFLDTPFLALFGLEYYVVTGGLALGKLLGFVVGAAIIIKRRVPEGAAKPKGILRPAGFGLAVILLGALWAVQTTAAESLLTAAAAKGLGEANGATVDVSGVELDLADSRFSVSDLAFADPKSLNTDLFRGIQLTADLSSASLLTKRVHVERLIISHVDSGLERAVPGVLIGDATEPELEDPIGEERSIEDYLQDWEIWRDRLGQAREWLESMSEDEEPGAPAGETTGERAERLAREQGYDAVVAEHLFTDAPAFLVDEFLIDGMEFSWLDGESFTLSAHNLSSQPSLVDGAMDLSLASSSDLFRLALALPSSRLGQPGELDFSIRDIPIDSLTSMLKLGEGNSVSGGSVSLSLKGPWSKGKAGYIDLPLEASLDDFAISLSGSKPFAVSNLKLPIHLRGPIDAPNVSVNSSALTQSLMDAGLTELVNFVETEKAKLINDGKAQLQDLIDDNASEVLNDLLGEDIQIDVGDLLEGNTENVQAQIEAAAKAKLELEARDLAATQLQELLGDKAAGMTELIKTGTKEQLEAAAQELAKEQLKQKGGDVLKDKLGEGLGGKLKGLGGIFGGKPK
jgi:hypothetical protein